MASNHPTAGGARPVLLFDNKTIVPVSSHAQKQKVQGMVDSIHGRKK